MRVIALIARVWRPLLPAFFVCLAQSLPGQGNSATGPAVAIVLSVQGEEVEVLRRGAAAWDPTKPSIKLFAGDQLRTGTNSRAVVRWTDQTVTPIAPKSHLDLTPDAGFNLFKGIMYFFHRGKPGKFNLRTPTASTAVLGTEFNLAVADDLTTTLTMFDGQVEMSNARGRLKLYRGEEGLAASGEPPQRTARIFTVNIIQWALYYPGILDLDELSLPPEAQTALSKSLAGYRKGDLLAALTAYPRDRQPASREEGIYRAALLLAVGEVESAEKLLKGLNGLSELNARLAGALRKLIAAVTLQELPSTSTSQPSTSSEWLAESYYQQSRQSRLSNLESARDAARRAVEK